MYIYIYRAFSTGGNGGRVPPTSQKFTHSPPHLEKFPPSRLLRTKYLSPPTTKQQFSSYNSIKTAFLAAVIAVAPFLF